jgi:hypothetical protein
MDVVIRRAYHFPANERCCGRASCTNDCDVIYGATCGRTGGSWQLLLSQANNLRRRRGESLSDPAGMEKMRAILTRGRKKGARLCGLSKDGPYPLTNKKADTKDEEATLLTKQPIVWNDDAEVKCSRLICSRGGSGRNRQTNNTGETHPRAEG